MPQPIRLKDHEKDARVVRRRVVVGALAILLLTMLLLLQASRTFQADALKMRNGMASDAAAA